MRISIHMNVIFFFILSGWMVRHTVSAEISRNLTSTLQPSTRTPQGRSYLDHRVLMPAPPACDVTAGRCDLHCCTDTDCSIHQRLSFSCPGETSKITPSSGWSCESRSTSSPAWFPLLCFVKNNSPYLGQFFPPDSRILSDFSTFKKTAKKTYHFYIPKHIPKPKIRSEYRMGDPIRIFRFDTGQETTLDLPNSIGGTTACVFRSPVHFLEPQKSKCLQKISAEICQSGELSIDQYVINDDVDFGFWVSKDGLQLSAVNTSTEVLCYSRVASHLVSEFGVRNHKLRTKPLNNVTDSLMLIPCNESSPVYKVNTGLCHNVLVSLTYRITWSGANITQIHTEFVLASLPVHVRQKKSHKYVTRQFEVQFVHDVKQDYNLTDENDITQERSGKPGYNADKPIVVGTLMWVNSSSENGSWQWETGHARLWTMGQGGECKSTRDLKFGYDVMTTCYVQTPAQLVTNCSAVRAQMRELLQSLVQGEHVAKQGDLQFESLQDVVPILRFDIDEIITLANNTEIKTSLNSSSVDNSTSSVDNNGTSTNNVTEDTSLCNVNSIAVKMCTDVPTGLHFTVLHAQHEFSSVRVDTVLGLVIKLTHSNMSSGSLTRIPVTTSVRFVPVHVQPTISRFWLRMFEPSAVAWHSILTPFFEALKSGDAAVQLLILWSVLFGAFVMSSLLWAISSK